MTQAQWFQIEQAAKLAKLYRTIAAVRRLTGNMILCRQAEAHARKYETELRDLASEIEYDAFYASTHKAIANMMRG
jgi:hypothetical protein